jgi:hypothetical protein
MPQQSQQKGAGYPVSGTFTETRLPIKVISTQIHG